MPTESPSLWYPPTLAALSRFKHLHFTHNVNKEANSMYTAMSLQRLGYEFLCDRFMCQLVLLVVKAVGLGLWIRQGKISKGGEVTQVFV